MRSSAKIAFSRARKDSFCHMDRSPFRLSQRSARLALTGKGCSYLIEAYRIFVGTA
jgi:hypothetical protein